MHKKGELSMKKHSDGSEEVTTKIYHGQLLPPDMLKEYKEIDPEFPIRILKWTEEESQHRRLYEKKYFRNNFIMNLSSHICYILATCAILLVSYLFMVNGFASEGMWIALSTSGFIGIFVIKKYITGSNPKKNNDPE